MKAADLIGKTADELKDNLLTLRKEQFSLRMQHATGQLPSGKRLQQVRRDIARIKTAQNGGLTAATSGAPKVAKPKAEKKATTTAAAKKPAAKKAAKE